MGNPITGSLSPGTSPTNQPNHTKIANLICITLHVINVIKDDYHWRGLTWTIPKIVINSDTEHHEHEQSNDCIGLLAEKFNLNINPGIHEDF